MNASTRRWLGILVISMTIGLMTGGVQAEDKMTTDSATGTWKSTYGTAKGQTAEVTHKLKQDGEKLTGTATGPRGREAAIEKGQVKDGEVSFQVIREFGDRKLTVKYQGKLSGDTIKGKMETNLGDQSRSFSWVAKRQQAATEKKRK